MAALGLGVQPEMATAARARAAGTLARRAHLDFGCDFIDFSVEVMGRAVLSCRESASNRTGSFVHDSAMFSASAFAVNRQLAIYTIHRRIVRIVSTEGIIMTTTSSADTGSNSEADHSHLRVPSRNILADDVYGILRDSLISGRVEPGSRLNLDQLARELHVSNTPVRQALARLEADGLVTKEPYRGFMASRLLDSRTIAELYEYRLILEPATAARAAANAPVAGLDELEELCDPDVVDGLLHDEAVAELGQRDIDFHCGIARLAGNSVVLENLTLTLTRMRLYTAYDRLGAGERAWHEHRLITDALRVGDQHAAAAAMRDHLRGAYERMRTSA